MADMKCSNCNQIKRSKNSNRKGGGSAISASGIVKLTSNRLLVGESRLTARAKN